MNLVAALHRSAAGLAGLGAVILAVSEGNYLLAAAAVIVAVCAWWLCDVKGWIELQNWSSNLASIVSLTAAGVRFYLLEADHRLLAIIDLMCYLQFILQFRRKTVRNLWMLSMISFLQVSVAAALQTSLLFAVLLTIYLYLGVQFLLLFYLFREREAFTDRADAAAADAARVGGGFAGRGPAQPPAPSMRRELARRTFALASGTFALAIFFFAVVPRVGQTKWNPGAIVGQREVGFSPEINLTRSGEIVEDPEVVMRVKFSDAATGKPHQPAADPYFRGTVLTFYTDGRWLRTSDFRGGREPLPGPPSGGLEGLIRQDITIEPLATTTLFSCTPWYSNTVDDRIKSLSYTQSLFRSDGASRQLFTYSLLTTPLRHPRNQKPCDVTPHNTARIDLRHLLQMPPPGPAGDPLAQLKATAASIVADIPAEDVVRRAKAIESYLRDSGRFVYTLYTPKRPEGVDPLEDFVTNDSRGHCEYFAGTLVMMLRSIGIPARIVVGYYGAEWNVVGNFYVVRQSNAHSWVEAYLAPQEAPLDRVPHEGQLAAVQRYGAWLRLDATAASDVVMTTARQSYWGEAKQVIDYLKFVWNNYVVGLDAATQQESIYRPIADRFRSFFRQLTDPRTWRDGSEGLVEYLHPQRWWPSEAGLWSRQGATVLFVAGVVLAVLYFSVRAVRRRAVRRRSVGVAAPRGVAVPVDFYVRLEQVLAGQKLCRAPEQTQREFVLSACGELAESSATRGVASLPRRIVDAFYRVRFGGRGLDAAELRDVEQALAELAAALPPRR